MRFGRLIAAATVAIGIAATGACDGNVPDPVKQAGYEALRAQLEATLTGAGFTNVAVTVEKESDGAPASATPAATAKATPRSSTSAKPGASSSPSSSAAAVTYDILSAVFDIPGLSCRGNVEQRLSPPQGKPYFDELILPDGTEHEVPADKRNLLSLDAVFTYGFTFAQCRQAGVTAPPAPVATGAGG